MRQSPADRIREREEELKRLEREKALEKMITGDEENLPSTVTSPKTDTVEVAVTSPSPSTSTSTVTDTVTSPLIKATDTYYRMIGYFISHQRDFIKKKAKKYNVTESEIMRIAMEELIKSGKI